MVAVRGEYMSWKANLFVMKDEYMLLKIDVCGTRRDGYVPLKVGMCRRRRLYAIESGYSQKTDIYRRMNVCVMKDEYVCVPVGVGMALGSIGETSTHGSKGADNIGPCEVYMVMDVYVGRWGHQDAFLLILGQT